MVYSFRGGDDPHKEDRGDMMLVVMPTEESGDMMLVVVPTTVLTSSA